MTNLQIKASEMEIDKNTQQFKKQLKKQNVRGLALDIDNVLSDTQVDIFNIMYTQFGSSNGMRVEELKIKYRYIQNVPIWQSKEAKQYLKNLVLSDQFYINIATIKDADRIVQKINKISPILCYITTRPNRVIPATKKWLKKNNFPEAPIIARPDDLELPLRGKWKAKVLEYLSPEISSIIDDDPEIVNYLPETYKGTIYLYNHPSPPETKIKVIPCKMWKDVYSKIKKFK
jgi:hypothetical protein